MHLQYTDTHIMTHFVQLCYTVRSMLEINSKPPDFALFDQYSKTRRLSEFIGSWVLLYFYPKDDTPGCTTEACQIRDIYTDFEKNGIIVIGVSHDAPESDAAFAAKYELPFILLSDPAKNTMKQFGAVGGVFTKRMSYLISPAGLVAKIYAKVDPANTGTQPARPIH